MIGKLFRVSIFGESHGKGVGVLIEGCPPGIPLDEGYIAKELERRKPGGILVSPRQESDKPRILSGVFRGRTTGGPLVIFVENRDIDSSFYEEIKDTPRPGHADYVARVKYWGFNDYRGGGISSGRITVGIVAAGAVAKRILSLYNIRVYSYIVRINGVEANIKPVDNESFRQKIYSNPLRCPDSRVAKIMEEELRRALREGDSLGGIVETIVFNVPVGLGDPPMNGLDSDLAKAMLSIPGAKGIEFGLGFKLASMKGSEANDSWTIRNGKIVAESNNMGGINGGISNGMPIIFRVVFKPTPTIRKPQKTVDLRTRRQVIIRGQGRHDPCIAIRAVPVVEAYTAIVLVDHLLRWLAWQPLKSRILGVESIK